MKYCGGCKQSLPLSKFGYHKSGRRNGKPRSQCIICSRQKWKEYYYNLSETDLAQLAKKRRKQRYKNKQIMIDKFRNICHDCGLSYPMCVFDFHHLDPKQKNFEPGLMFGWSLERIQKELKKCIMLCANCHRLRHHESFSRC